MADGIMWRKQLLVFLTRSTQTQGTLQVLIKDDSEFMKYARNTFSSRLVHNQCWAAGGVLLTVNELMELIYRKQWAAASHVSWKINTVMSTALHGDTVANHNNDIQKVKVQQSTGRPEFIVAMVVCRVLRKIQNVRLSIKKFCCKLKMSCINSPTDT